MNRTTARLFSICLAALSASDCARDGGDSAEPRMDYPETMTVDHVDRYHGVTVADPYRWLEEDVRESGRVQQWVAAQNELTFAYLASIPEREAIEAGLTELWDYKRFGLPVKEGGRYYYSYNDGLMNQAVIYTQPALDAEAKLLIDPNAWSEGGTVALAGYYPDPDGRHVAYLVQEAGSDWNTARVLDVESGEILGDALEWLKFTGLEWAKDGSGFYYSRNPAIESSGQYQSLNLDQALYFHELGTPQSEDDLVYRNREHPEWNYFASVTAAFSSSPSGKGPTAATRSSIRTSPRRVPAP